MPRQAKATTSQWVHDPQHDRWYKGFVEGCTTYDDYYLMCVYHDRVMSRESGQIAMYRAYINLDGLHQVEIGWFHTADQGRRALDKIVTTMLTVFKPLVSTGE